MFIFYEKRMLYHILNIKMSYLSCFTVCCKSNLMKIKYFKNDKTSCKLFRVQQYMFTMLCLQFSKSLNCQHYPLFVLLYFKRQRDNLWQIIFVWFRSLLSYTWNILIPLGTGSLLSSHRVRWLSLSLPEECFTVI
jgi:hypothetical protein